MKDQRLHDGGRLGMHGNFQANQGHSGSHLFKAVLILSALLFSGSMAHSAIADDAPHVEPILNYPEIYIDVEVLTAEPSVSHAIELRAFGSWRIGCAPEYVSHSIIGNTVQIFADAEPMGMVCSQVIQDWGFELSLIHI